MSWFLALVDWLHHYDIVLMVLVFLVIFVTTYWPRRRDAVEQYGRIPLDDDR